jgi:prepilin-type N-terminal cleavage/methylation domain-containing protein
MRKGFTVVELAIVLVIIGIILAMSVKGRSLVETAKYKAEINKIRKLEAATHIWLAMHPDSFNLMQNAGQWGQVNMQDFYDRGIITEGELKSMAVESISGPNRGSHHGENGYWRIIRCQHYGEGLATYASMRDNPRFSGISFIGGNFCAQITIGIESPVNRATFWWVNMPPRLQCMTELIMDDQSKTSGIARYDVRFPNPAEFTEAEYKDCMALSMVEPRNSNLFYALY